MTSVFLFIGCSLPMPRGASPSRHVRGSEHRIKSLKGKLLALIKYTDYESHYGPMVRFAFQGRRSKGVDVLAKDARA